MSYPYPQDRHRDRKEKGEQPYKDAKERFSQQNAALRGDELEYAEGHQPQSDQDRIARLEADAAERLSATSEQLRREQIDKLLVETEKEKE